MRNCDIIIGAFWRSTFFDDVEIDPDTPDPAAAFTTTLEERWPATMLNDTQPNGFPVGTGGADAINRQYKLMMASPPKFDQPDKSVEDDGINGNLVAARIRSVPRALNVGLKMPDTTPEDASYGPEWDDLKLLCSRKVLIYVLHRSFAFRGWISSAPDLFLGELFESSVVPFVFKIDAFYRPVVSGSAKLYDRILFS